MKKISVIGGDERIARLIDIAEKRGIRVCSYGIDAGIIKAYSLSDAFEFSNTVVLPLPVCSERNIINAPLSRCTVTTDQIIELVCSETHIIGGKIDSDFSYELKSRGARVSDIMEREDFAVLNAIPTAEGAVAVAIDNTDFTLHSSNVLILGFGRIGKALTRVLSGMGVKLFVAARNERDLAYASLCGADPVKLSSADFAEKLSRADIVYNTVPTTVLNDDCLALMKKDALIIDLASNPGGVDKKAAAARGIRVIHALSLPVKYSPITAANILADTVLNAAEV